MSKSDNWKEVDVYYHYMYDDLLVVMALGGDLLKQSALKFRKALAVKNVFIDKITLRSYNPR